MDIMVYGALGYSMASKLVWVFFFFGICLIAQWKLGWTETLKESISKLFYLIKGIHFKMQVISSCIMTYWFIYFE